MNEEERAARCNLSTGVLAACFTIKSVQLSPSELNHSYVYDPRCSFTARRTVLTAGHLEGPAPVVEPVAVAVLVAVSESVSLSSPVP